MKQMTRKVIGIAFIIVMLMLIPAISFAGNITNDEVQIVEINEGKCMIYIKGLENTEFNYALFLSSSNSEMETNYIHSVKDGEGNQVALVEKNDYDFRENPKAYLKIKIGDEISNIEIDFSKAYSKEKMEEVENTTKKINVEIVSNLEEEDRVDENGVHLTVKVGGLKITETSDANYLYQTKIADGKYEELMNLAEEMNSQYNNMNMFDKIQISEKFYKLYNELIQNANWEQVENMEIRQPKEANKDTKYVVLIKKENNNEVITDVQFLTCKEEQIPSYEKEKIITQETSKLPITGDNIILIISFLAVVVLLVLTFIKIKKSNQKEERK